MSITETPNTLTPPDWLTGHGITLAAVGFTRFYFGGRPHTLGWPEPAAWGHAWSVIEALRQPAGLGLTGATVERQDDSEHD